MTGARSVALAGGVALAAALSVATVRQLRVGARAMQDSDAALTAHDVRAAIVAAHEAAESQAPGTPYVRAGFLRLESLARDAETRHDDRTAIAAWSAMRAAASATRGPFTSNPAWLALAEDGIARDGSRADPTLAEVHATEPLIRALLSRDEGATASILALLAAGAVAFLAGAARVAFAAQDLAGLRRERTAALIAVTGLALYLVACLRA